MEDSGLHRLAELVEALFLASLAGVNLDESGRLPEIREELACLVIEVADFL